MNASITISNGNRAAVIRRNGGDTGNFLCFFYVNARNGIDNATMVRGGGSYRTLAGATRAANRFAQVAA